MFNRWVPIPTEFHSLYFEGPFTRCIDCDADLTQADIGYSIQRAFKGTEPIFEMAMCDDCHTRIASELSKESSQRIQAYVEERVDLEERLREALLWDESKLSEWIGRCTLLKIPLEDCREYQITARCRGKLMSLDFLPLMISGEASREMQKLLSKKSRDRLGDLVEEHFGMPGEFADGPTPMLM